MKNKSKVIISILAISLALGITKTSFAQTTRGLTISPPTFELTANPGNTLENSIKITNNSDSDMRVSTFVRNFTALGEEGSVDLTDEETTYSLASWIKVEPESAIIPAKATHFFTFFTSVPLNAEPGGHFGSVVFRMGGGTPTETGASVAQEIASLVLLKIAGNAYESASIESFGAKLNFYEYGPVDFEIRVKNEGNIHVKPKGSITITNMLGKTVSIVDVEPKNILPNAIRKMSATLDKKWLIGKHTATVILSYNNEKDPIVATTTFTAFPYKVACVGLIVGFIIFAILFKMRRRIKLAFNILLGKYEQK